MTTFQAIIYGVIHGFAEFLPISAAAHDSLVSLAVGWPAPEGAFAGALSLGALLAVLIYFRHDWASMISCFLQVIIFRKRPMTLDERLPIFLFITSVPAAAGWYYLHERIAGFEWTPYWIAGSLVAFSLPLWFADFMSRKNKGMFDWNWLDCLTVGVFEIASFLPGCGQMSAAIPGALVRNYNRESAAKYAFYALTPMLAASAVTQLRGASLPSPELSWLSFAVALMVTLLSGILAIGGLMRSAQGKGFGAYIGYRWLLAAVIAGLYWVKTS